jgi:phi LC3 family holin
MLKNINWKVRFKNKVFWVALIPLLLLLITQAAGIFGFELDLSILGDKLVALVETVFMILALVGVVADVTTPGVQDSQRAMGYVEPGVPKEE